MNYAMMRAGLCLLYCLEIDDVIVLRYRFKGGLVKCIKKDRGISSKYVVAILKIFFLLNIYRLTDKGKYLIPK